MPPPSVRLQQCCCKTIQRCCNVATRCVRAHLPACMPARTRTHAALVQIAGGCASRVQRLDAIVATLTGTHLLMSTAHSGTYMSARTVAHTVYSLSRASLPVVPFGRRLRVNLVAIIAVCFPIVIVFVVVTRIEIARARIVPLRPLHRRPAGRFVPWVGARLARRLAAGRWSSCPAASSA